MQAQKIELLNKTLINWINKENSAAHCIEFMSTLASPDLQYNIHACLPPASQIQVHERHRATGDGN